MGSSSSTASSSTATSKSAQSRVNVNAPKAEVKKWIEVIEKQALHKERRRYRHEFIMLCTVNGRRFRIDRNPSATEPAADDSISLLDYAEYERSRLTSDLILGFEWKDLHDHQLIDLRMAITVMLAISECGEVAYRHWSSNCFYHSQIFMATFLRFFIGCSIRVDDWESPALLGKAWENQIAPFLLPRDCQSAIDLAITSRVTPWIRDAHSGSWQLEFWTAVSPIIGSCWRISSNDNYQDHELAMCPAAVFMAKILSEQLAKAFREAGVNNLYKTVQSLLKTAFYQLFYNEFSNTVMDITLDAQQDLFPHTIWSKDRIQHEVQGATGCFAGKSITVQPVFLLPKGTGIFAYGTDQHLSFEAVRKWMVDVRRKEVADEIALRWEDLKSSCWLDECTEKSM
ncbi:hypothetical protein DL96DRAFT_1581720 [Flagelloscypha sp. PMI_526]|nr:hypothetical protein DL96DRAFT_1581720 [Flagelloscypha sp. PMI_526]